MASGTSASRPEVRPYPDLLWFEKLFHAQFYLKANAFESHEEWKKAWREKRSNQFFVLGSKDETAGCQGCVATPNEDGSYTLRVRLPNALSEEHLLIPGVRLEYGQEQWEEARACGRAVSYRFLRDPKSWRLFVSTKIEPVQWISQRRRGAIGIDINPDQLVLAEEDHHGNFIGGK